MSDPERDLANEIRDGLWTLRREIKAGSKSALLIWPMPGKLACAQRPLRDHPTYGGSAKALPEEASAEVLSWVSRIQEEGLRSILCLMHAKEFKYYEPLKLHPEGLLGLYKERGFRVHHIPWADPAHAKSEQSRIKLKNRVHEIKVEAYQAFRELPHPVLLHCSAGIDRSAPVAAYIVLREREAREAG
jgi:hypothetical protein